MTCLEKKIICRFVYTVHVCSSLRASSWARGLFFFFWGGGMGWGEGKERELVVMSHKFECHPQYSQWLPAGRAVKI